MTQYMFLDCAETLFINIIIWNDSELFRNNLGSVFCKQRPAKIMKTITFSVKWKLKYFG